MPTLVRFSPFAQSVLVLASAVVALAGLRAINDIATPFLMAGLVAVAAFPLEDALVRRGVRKGIAFAITFALCGVIVIAVAVFFGVAIQQTARGLSVYEDDIRELIAEAQTQAEAAGLIDSATLDASLSASNIIGVLQSAANFVLSSSGSVVLIFLFLLYFLMEGDEIGARVRAALGPDHPAVGRMRAFVASTQQYLLSRTIFGLIIAAIQTGVMLVMGVNFALLWGVLSFVCNFIPNIGFIVGIVPPAVLLLAEQGVGPAVVFIVLYAVINNVIENLIAPRYVGQSVNLSPLTTFLSLTLWATVLGAAGAFLAVPMTLFVKLVLLGGDPSMRGVVALMSANASESDAPTLPEGESAA